MGEFVLRESKAGGAARVAAEFRRARAVSRLGAGPADRARLFAASFYLLARAQTARRGHDRVSVTIRAFGRQGRVTLSDYSQLLLLEAIFIDGDYDVPLATPPRTIVDLGSNIGVSILYFKLRFPDAHVIGVEPDPVAFALLRRNTAAARARHDPPRRGRGRGGERHVLVGPGSGRLLTASHARRAAAGRGGRLPAPDAGGGRAHDRSAQARRRGLRVRGTGVDRRSGPDRRRYRRDRAQGG